MSEITLVPKTNGQVIDQTWYGDFVAALGTDLVPRNASGVPTAGQNLGNALYPWGDLYATSFILNGELLDFSEVLSRSPYKIISGRVRSTSNQPAFLRPGNPSLSVTIQGSVTPLVYEIKGTRVTLSTDIVISGLTGGPASANTATLNMAGASGQEATRTWGEESNKDGITSLVIASAGANITSLVGTRQSFYISNGGDTCVFTAFIESATSLTQCYRGFWYNSTINAINREKIANGNTITIMKMGWVFLDVDGATAEVIYTEPTYSFTQPSATTLGLYWYDLSTSTWKRANGTIYVEVERILIGYIGNYDTTNAFARCVDFFGNYSELNNVDPIYVSASTAKGKAPGQAISVLGNTYDFGFVNPPVWSMASHLITNTGDCYNTSEQASRRYFFYVKDTGALAICDVDPYRRWDLRGWYHPHNPWRCVGYVDNDSGSDFTSTTVTPLTHAKALLTTLDLRDLSVTTGKLNDLAVTTGKIAARAVTRYKQTLPPIQTNSVGVDATVSSTGYTDVVDSGNTLQAVVLVEEGGRPILINVQPTGITAGGNIGAAPGITVDIQLLVSYNGGGFSEIAHWGGYAIETFPCMITYLDTAVPLNPTPGVAVQHHYKMRAQVSSGNVNFNRVQMVATEI